MNEIKSGERGKEGGQHGFGERGGAKEMYNKRSTPLPLCFEWWGQADNTPSPVLWNFPPAEGRRARMSLEKRGSDWEERQSVAVQDRHVSAATDTSWDWITNAGAHWAVASITPGHHHLLHHAIRLSELTNSPGWTCTYLDLPVLHVLGETFFQLEILLSGTCQGSLRIPDKTELCTFIASFVGVEMVLRCDAWLTESFPLIMFVIAADALCGWSNRTDLRICWVVCLSGVGVESGDPAAGGPWHGDTFEWGWYYEEEWVGVSTPNQLCEI